MNDKELLTNKKYKPSLFELNECSICLDVLQNKVLTTRCNHKYHFNCIKQWVQKHKYNTSLCPLCNQSFAIKSVKTINIYNKDDIYIKNNVYDTEPGIKYIFSQTTIDNEDNKDNKDNEDNEDNYDSFSYICCNIL